jgi:hypothetical protein
MKKDAGGIRLARYKIRRDGSDEAEVRQVREDLLHGFDCIFGLFAAGYNQFA